MDYAQYQQLRAMFRPPEDASVLDRQARELAMELLKEVAERAPELGDIARLIALLQKNTSKPAQARLGNHGAMSSFRQVLSQNEDPRLIVRIIAAVVCEFSDFDLVDVALKSDPAKITLLNFEISTYAAFLAAEQTGEAVHLKQALSEYEQRFDKVTEQGQSKLRAVFEGVEQESRRIREAAERVEGIENSTQNNVAQLEKKISEFANAVTAGSEKTEALSSQIEAHRAAVFEGINHQSISELWTRRAKSNGRAYWLSMLILVGLLIGGPVLVFFHFDWVIGKISSISIAAGRAFPTSGANGVADTISLISRLIFITVPLGLYIWFIRLVVRYNQRSLTLADDAEQRDAILNTYLSLLAENAAQMEDRAVVLAALFRPLPGHGPDNVDPPQFTDLLESVGRAGKGGPG